MLFHGRNAVRPELCSNSSWISFSVLAFLLSLGSQARSQETQPVDIKELAWIAGHWQGEALGGQFEETWNPPKGGAMMGMFKLVKDDSVSFYEILTIVPTKDQSLVLRLKHFSSELKGWEEKDETLEFPLVSVTKNEARFEGLVFKRKDADHMEIRVKVSQGDGTSELVFPCERAKPLAASQP